MNIEFAPASHDFALKNYVFRDLKNHFDVEHERYLSMTHFQAIIADGRKKRENSVICRLTYEGESGEFLGFDEQPVYSSTDSEFISVSIPVTIPEKVARTTLTIEEAKYYGTESVWVWLFGGFLLIAAVVYLVD